MMLVPFFISLQLQQGKPVHPGHKASASQTEDTRPVSVKEAAMAFDRVGSLLRRTSGVPFGNTAIPRLDRPVTRDEVVGEMDRLYRTATPAIRFIPAPTKHDPSVLRIDAPLKPTLDRLVTLGLVARIGPLAVGPSSNLTPKEMGDAIGQFMARIAQMSHVPSSKWTPMLKSD